MAEAGNAGTQSEAGRVFAQGLVGGRFRIEATARQEAGFSVCRATDTRNGAAATVRLYPSALAGDVPKVQGLEHRNLVTVLGCGKHGGHFYVASESENDDHSLRQLIEAQREQSSVVGEKYALTLLGHVANGLAELHKIMPHGCVTPENIWVSRAGRVRVGAPGVALRSGAYAAPEAVRGEAPSAASDIYSLGAILQELLAGTPVPSGKSASALRVPIAAVVAKALSEIPATRFATPEAMSEAVGRALGTAAVPPAPSVSSPGASKTFDVAASAGLSDSDQRWLIQKDRLDFGPFSAVQIVAQMEAGAFNGDDLLVDMDSGARQKIKDHPELGDLAKAAERKREATRRAHAEHTHARVERGKSRALILIIGGAALSLGIAAFIFLSNRRAAEESTLDSRAAEADIDAFLKGVKIDFSQPKHRSRRGGGGGKDEFSNDMNLGDVSKGGGDEVLSDRVVQNVMMSHYRALVPCIMEERRKNAGLSDIEFEFVILGSGKVSAVRINGQRNGSFPACALGKMQNFGFPKFNGKKTLASWSMSMR